MALAEPQLAEPRRRMYRPGTVVISP